MKKNDKKRQCHPKMTPRKYDIKYNNKYISLAFLVFVKTKKSENLCFLGSKRDELVKYI